MTHVILIHVSMATKQLYCQRRDDFVQFLSDSKDTNAYAEDKDAFW